MGGGKRLHGSGAHLPARVGVGACDQPKHVFHRVHGPAQRRRLDGGVGRARPRLRVEGHQRKGLHQVKARRFAQFLPGHFGQSADILVPQAAHAEHAGRVLAHADQPPGAVNAGGEMRRRHLGDAVAVVFVGGAQRHVPARNVGDGDMPRRCGGRHREDLEPVAQQKHRVGAAGGEMIVEHRQRAGDGAGRRLAVVVRKDGKPRRDGQAVRLDLGHGGAQPRAEVRPGDHQLQGQRAAGRQLLDHRPQQAVFRPRGGDDGDNGGHGGTPFGEKLEIRS